MNEAKLTPDQIYHGLIAFIRARQSHLAGCDDFETWYQQMGLGIDPNTVKRTLATGNLLDPKHLKFELNEIGQEMISDKTRQRGIDDDDLDEALPVIKPEFLGDSGAAIPVPGDEKPILIPYEWILVSYVEDVGSLTNEHLILF